MLICPWVTEQLPTTYEAIFRRALRWRRRRGNSVLPGATAMAAYVDVALFASAAANLSGNLSG